MLRLSPPGRLRLEQARSLERLARRRGAERRDRARTARDAGRVGLASCRATRSDELVLAHARSAGVERDGARVRRRRAARALLRRGRRAAAGDDRPVRPRRVGVRAARPGRARLAGAARGRRAPSTRRGITPVALGRLRPRDRRRARGRARERPAARRTTSTSAAQLAPPERWRELLERFAPSLDVVLCSADDARGARTARPTATRSASGSGSQLLVLAELDEDGRDVDGVRRGTGPSRRPRRSLRPVDPIGAGDAFDAGFLHRLLAGGSMADALAWGRAAATLKLTVPGDAPLLDLEEVAAAAAGVETEAAPVRRPPLRPLRRRRTAERTPGLVEDTRAARAPRATICSLCSRAALPAAGRRARSASTRRRSTPAPCAPAPARPAARSGAPASRTSAAATRAWRRATVQDVYALVYDAERPELFLKDAGWPAHRRAGRGDRRPLGRGLVGARAGARARARRGRARCSARSRATTSPRATSRARTRSTCRRRRSTRARARSGRPCSSRTTGTSRSRSGSASVRTARAPCSSRARPRPRGCAGASPSSPPSASATTPCPPGSVLLTGTGPRPARRLHARAGPDRRDPHRRHRAAPEPRRASRPTCSEGGPNDRDDRGAAGPGAARTTSAASGGRAAAAARTRSATPRVRPTSSARSRPRARRTSTRPSRPRRGAFPGWGGAARPRSAPRC